MRFKNFVPTSVSRPRLLVVLWSAAALAVGNLWLDVRADPSDAGASPRALRAASAVYECRGAAVAIGADTMSIDGDLSDWKRAHFQRLGPDTFDVLDEDNGAAGDVGARFAFQWSADTLYLAVEVDDDVHSNTLPPSQMWKGDSLQLAVDAAGDGGHAYDDDNDYELGWSYRPDGVQQYRFVGPRGARSTDTEAVVRRDDRTTIYEIAIPARGIGLHGFSRAADLRAALLVNDSDGRGREGFLEWATGIGREKHPASFGRICFIDLD